MFPTHDGNGFPTHDGNVFPTKVRENFALVGYFLSFA